MGNQLQVQRRRRIRVNGFVIDHSHMTLVKWLLVKWLFQTYPETADNVNVQNQKLRSSYMKLLCGIIETLYHTPLCDITEADLFKASKDLFDLTQAGFKLYWLESKLDMISLEKKTSEERLMQLNLELNKFLMTMSDLKDERKKEKKKLTKRPTWIHED